MSKTNKILVKKGSPSKTPKAAKVRTGGKQKKAQPKVIQKAVDACIVETIKPSAPKIGEPPIKVLRTDETMEKKEAEKALLKIKKKAKKADEALAKSLQNGQKIKTVVAKETSVKDATEGLQNGETKKLESLPNLEKGADKTAQLVSPTKPSRSDETVEEKKARRKRNKAEKKLKKQAETEATKALQTKAKKPAVEKSSRNTVFVGNLPTNTKRVQLYKLFASYAPIISVRFRTSNGKVIFKHAARKKSDSLNAYIVLKDADTAAKALDMNGCEFKGNHLRVTKSENTNPEADQKRLIFVGNLKKDCNDEKLRQIFSSCGEIEYIRRIQSPDQSGCKGVAYVCFKSPDAVGLGLELNGTILDERPIRIETYSLKKLGAKAKRDAEEAANQKAVGPQKGGKPGKKSFPGKKPIAEGKKQIEGNKPHNGAQNNAETSAAGNGKNKKKSEYRGVKSETHNKKKTKKQPSAMKKLAAKIAPRNCG